jgi:hypothetical protein
VKTIAKTKRSPRRAVSVKGDIARAMFARWEREHTDPQPLSWDKFKAKLEANRLREAPLFAK